MMDTKVAEQKVEIATEIEQLRQKINQLVAAGCINSPRISVISKQIDKLVIQYMKLDDTSV